MFLKPQTCCASEIQLRAGEGEEEESQGKYLTSMHTSLGFYHLSTFESLWELRIQSQKQDAMNIQKRVFLRLN